MIAPLLCMAGFKNLLMHCELVVKKQAPELKSVSFFGFYVIIHNLAGKLLGLILSLCLQSDYDNGKWNLPQSELFQVINGSCIVVIELLLAIRASSAFAPDSTMYPPVPSGDDTNWPLDTIAALELAGMRAQQLSKISMSRGSMDTMGASRDSVVALLAS